MRIATELHKYSPELLLTKHQAEDLLKQFSIRRVINLKMCRECRINVNEQGYIWKDSLELYIKDQQQYWAEVEGIPQPPFLPQPVLRHLIIVTIKNARVLHEKCYITANSNNVPYMLRHLIPFVLLDHFEELTCKLGGTQYLLYRGMELPEWIDQLPATDTTSGAQLGPDDIDTDLRDILYPNEDGGAIIL